MGNELVVNDKRLLKWTFERIFAVSGLSGIYNMYA